MSKIIENYEIIRPINKLYLFGYEYYFKIFQKLFEKGKLPNSILLNGPKGLGKSTFIYHFINFILSKDEKDEYSLKDFAINQDNLSYKLLCSNTHPNFFLIDKLDVGKDIKIDQIRNVTNFLSKSVYSKNLKIVMINNAELLNLNSSNALLKSLEEPQKNTFFFIIHNSSFKILDTIKSRCSIFNIFFSSNKKREIFKNIIEDYDKSFDLNSIEDYFYFDTPGNLLINSLSLLNNDLDIKQDKLDCIFYLMEKYKKEKNLNTLSVISLYIEYFYNNLLLNNNKNINNYFFNKNKIIKKINDLKKFNLDEKITFITIKNILLNETR